MPVYLYKCGNEKCNKTFAIFHLIEEPAPTDCEECATKDSLFRDFNPAFNVYKPSDSVKAGDNVKKAISQMKEDLKQQKEEMEQK